MLSREKRAKKGSGYPEMPSRKAVFSAEHNVRRKEVRNMLYEKPKVTNVIAAIAAVRSDTTKADHNVDDAISGQPKQKSAAYEADE